jgi:histidinol dehydrogenase
MANRRYIINEEFEVNLKFKVKLKQISNYHQLSDKEIKEEIEITKNYMKEFFQKQIKDEYWSQELDGNVDYWDFDVEPLSE